MPLAISINKAKFGQQYIRSGRSRVARGSGSGGQCRGCCSCVERAGAAAVRRRRRETHGRALAHTCAAHTRTLCRRRRNSSRHAAARAHARCRNSASARIRHLAPAPAAVPSAAR
eukprot:scaffold13433_cov67-Phaeocystis_antarctica.AAC.5